jgi:hypothetical protein
VKFPLGEDRIPRSWLAKPDRDRLEREAMDLKTAASIVYAGAPGNLEAPVFTPLPTAEVIHLRVENKANAIARISRQISEKEQVIAELAHDIWLLKLEREGVQDHG